MNGKNRKVGVEDTRGLLAAAATFRAVVDSLGQFLARFAKEKRNVSQTDRRDAARIGRELGLHYGELETWIDKVAGSMHVAAFKSEVAEAKRRGLSAAHVTTPSPPSTTRRRPLEELTNERAKRSKSAVLAKLENGGDRGESMKADLRRLYEKGGAEAVAEVMVKAPPEALMAIDGLVQQVTGRSARSLRRDRERFKANQAAVAEGQLHKVTPFRKVRYGCCVCTAGRCCVSCGGNGLSLSDTWCAQSHPWQGSGRPTKYAEISEVRDAAEYYADQNPNAHIGRDLVETILNSSLRQRMEVRGLHPGTAPQPSRYTVDKYCAAMGASKHFKGSAKPCHQTESRLTAGKSARALVAHISTTNASQTQPAAEYQPGTPQDMKDVLGTPHRPINPNLSATAT